MGDKIPEFVYLRVQNCDSWRGNYRPNNACIENLGWMMSYYNVKPYNLVLLQYKGEGNFEMQIFNDNTVEIDYPMRKIGVKKARLTENEEIFSDIELEKLSAKFSYNAFKNSRISHEVIIKTEHLQDAEFIQVLC